MAPLTRGKKKAGAPALAPVPAPGPAKKAKATKGGRVAKAKPKAKAKAKAAPAAKAKGKAKANDDDNEDEDDAITQWENRGDDEDILKAFNAFKAADKRSILKALATAKTQLARVPAIFLNDGTDPAEDAHEPESFGKKERGKFLENNEQIHGENRAAPNISVGTFCSVPAEALDNSEDGRIDLKHDPYCLRKHFTTQWGVLATYTANKHKGGANPTWRDSEWLVQQDDPALYLDQDIPHGSATSLEDRLGSSMNLLYRMMVTFGVEPTTRPGDKGKHSWKYVLWHQDDDQAELHIGNDDGEAFAKFYGDTAGTSNEALQLMEWLTGEHCPLSPTAILNGGDA